ncbi:putative nuclease HARBI1 [Cucumis melo var. makuwa]|uniref:Uncharacterized protein LOC107990502 n=2 Tax=Cucumis melo TaxID=3656 RepID=A0A1S4DTX0_CUCME|nr:uncharacterized protein LOC107990502 [Cucumis melo]TYK24441.1 putative nuclease HARBI1 [Cucumis melo var. makuwa]
MHNCLGALDNTYIKGNVPAHERSRYRTRKGDVVTNVFGVCDTKGNFVFVLAGWEGSAADSCILQDAISRPNDLKVPKGFYYLCNVEYLDVEGFQAPYRGQRYNLQEWRGAKNPPSTTKKFFNMKHSFARNYSKFFKGPKHLWTKEENATLMECLVKLVNSGGWKSDNKIFRPGYEGFAIGDGNDMEIPIMFSQGLNMLLGEFMGSRPERSGDSRNASSGSKRKRP